MNSFDFNNNKEISNGRRIVKIDKSTYKSNYILLQKLIFENKKSKLRPYHEGLNKFILEQNPISIIINNIFPDINSISKENIIERLNNLKNKNMIIEGPFQSMKSQVIASLILNFHAFNISSILITRNFNSEKIGIKNKILSFQNNANDYFKINNYNEKPVSIIDKKFLDVKTINSFLPESENPLVLLSLNNKSHLTKLISSTANTTNTTNTANTEDKKLFILFIDEADFIDSNSKTSDLLQILKERAIYVIYISATPLDPIIKNKCLSKDYIQLEKPKYYKGIDSYKINRISSECTMTTRINDNILENDIEIESYIEQLADKPLIYEESYEEYHPLIHLISVSNVNQPQTKLRNYIIENYSETFTVLTWYDKNITMYNCSLKENIKTNEIVSELEGKFHIIKKKHTISDVLNYLRLNGGVSKFPRIIILAGTLAGRSNSFTSGNCIDSYMGWRLTGYRMLVSNKTDIPELLQKAGRGCCNTKSNFQLEFYTTEKIWTDIVKGIMIKEELIERSEDYDSFIEPQDTLSECIEKVPILKEKLTKRSITKTSKYKLNIKKDNDNGWSIENYNEFIEKDIIYSSSEEESEYEDDRVYESEEEKQIDYSTMENIFYIDSEIISVPAKKFYDMFKNTILNSNALNTWEYRHEIINIISDKDVTINNSYRTAAENMCKFSYNHNLLTDNENTEGLLFKRSYRDGGKRWLIRFNTKQILE
jgi:hypothetical protein